MHSRSRNEMIKQLRNQSTEAIFRGLLQSLKLHDWLLAKDILFSVPDNTKDDLLAFLDRYEAKNTAYLMLSLARAIEIIHKYNVLTKNIYGSGKTSLKVDPKLLSSMKETQDWWYQEIKQLSLSELSLDEDFEYYQELNEFLRVSEKKGIEQLEQSIRLNSEEMSNK